MLSVFSINLTGFVFKKPINYNPNPTLMKKYFILFAVILTGLGCFAQTPAKMSYQAVIRDGDGQLVTNTQVGVQISLLQGSVTGSPIYAERQSPKANANGLVSFIIGEGNIISGDFNNIDWEHGPYFIETSTDPTGGTNYTITGTTPLLSVPYALHSKSAETLSGTIDASQITNLGDLSGDGIDGTESAFNNWDKDANDDFSGAYQDLANKPRLFSGKYADLSGRPELYNRDQVDSLVASTGSEGTVQSLRLNNQELSITGGNSVSFENWDTDNSDDFSGNYEDLQGRPKLFSGSYTDLRDLPDLFGGDYNKLQNLPEIYTRPQVDSLVLASGSEGTVQSLELKNKELRITGGNTVSFENWDINAKDDFSGKYSDLKNVPPLYTSPQVDSIFTVNRQAAKQYLQSLSMQDKKLVISGGNSVSLENWDADASDDFSGEYGDLKNAPVVYTKEEVDDLLAANNGGSGTIQSLALEGNELSISGSNTISFENWDADASDDFDGKYSSLTGAPKIYTQTEVDSIKAEIIQNLADNYMKKPKVNTISSSRDLKPEDIGNTIACTTSTTLTIKAGFSQMNIGDAVNLEVHGTTLTIKGASVTINGVSSGKASIGNDQAYTGGILRKTGTNSYIVL